MNTSLLIKYMDNIFMINKKELLQLFECWYISSKSDYSNDTIDIFYYDKICTIIKRKIINRNIINDIQSIEFIKDFYDWFTDFSSDTDRDFIKYKQLVRDTIEKQLKNVKNDLFIEDAKN